MNMNTKINDKLKAINTNDEIVEFVVINGKVTCSQLSLKEILYIPDTVTKLICYLNYLTELPDNLENLKHLNCSGNKLTQLSNLPNVKYLNCSSNKLTQLPNTLHNVEHLECYGNELTELPNNLYNLIYLNHNEKIEINYLNKTEIRYRRISVDEYRKNQSIDNIQILQF